MCQLSEDAQLHFPRNAEGQIEFRDQGRTGSIPLVVKDGVSRHGQIEGSLIGVSMGKGPWRWDCYQGVWE
jgi:hypothetical protein